MEQMVRGLWLIGGGNVGLPHAAGSRETRRRSGSATARKGAHRLIRRLIPASLVLGFTLCVGQSAAWATLEIGANHVLTQDLHDNIVITANDVELDCGNRKVKPNYNDDDYRNCPGCGSHNFHPPLSGYGITVNGKSGVTIRNCVVYWWDRGISIDNSSNIQLINNSVTTNNDGYDINFSSNVTIRGGTVALNIGDGIDLDNDRHVLVESDSIHDNYNKGITVNRQEGSSGVSDNITISQCLFIDNGVGIRFEWVRDSAISGNSFSDNGCLVPYPHRSHHPDEDYCPSWVYPTGGHIVFKSGRTANIAVEGNYCRPNDVSQDDYGPCSVITQ